MSKDTQYLRRRTWLIFSLAGVIFCLLHGGVFLMHAFFVFRYQSLYDQIIASGATVQVPENFLEAYKQAQGRSFFSRPHTLAKEIGILHSGTNSLLYQYKNDIYRLHDSVVQYIKYLGIALEKGNELSYPGKDLVSQQAIFLQNRLDSVPPGDIRGLIEVSTLAKHFVDVTQKNIEYAEKKLILQDILAFKHEMLLFEDIHRLYGQKIQFDKKKFWTDFSTLFHRNTLLSSSSDILRGNLNNLRLETQSYRDMIKNIRDQNSEKRLSWVENEYKKWEKLGITPPLSPLPHMYQLIYVSLEKQMMYVYEDNELILSTSITSGRRNFETIRGTFRVYTKQRGKLMKSPFPDEEYELWVDYWLGFSGAYGIHDACNSTDCWRTKFGGASYIYNGSHGCVNTPYNAVKFIYNWAKVGTTVYVR